MPHAPFATDAEIWETYRLYQRDMLKGCFDDADLMLRGHTSHDPEADRRLVVQLLFQSRVKPWGIYRNEQRALVRR